MARQVTHEDGLLRVSFNYEPRLVEMVRGVPGRKWHPRDKTWTIPSTQVVQVVDLLLPAGFEFDRDTLELYERHKDLHEDHYTVSRLNAEARAALARAFPAPVWLVGEISGFSKSAHKNIVDFQLVDRDEEGRTLAQVNAVLFHSQRQAIQDKLAREGQPFLLEDEITVRVQVQVELHPEWGAFRVVVQDIDVAYTLGEAARRREEILRTLSAEGLLERNSSLPFPVIPLRVGLITSPGSDAERDALNTLQESGYAFHVTVHGARVQGRETEPTMLRALAWFASRASDFDVVLICRGGGSRTDLAWLDSLALGREVAAFPLPVVVGIGHENDRSVLDEVGRRAKTPTAAAQILVGQVAETMDHAARTCARAIEIVGTRLVAETDRTNGRAQRLAQTVKQALTHAQRDLHHGRHRLLQGARALLNRTRQAQAARVGGLPRAAGYMLGREHTHLDAACRRLLHASRGHIAREQERTSVRTRRLELVHPRRVLERGYALLRSRQGRVVTAPEHAPAGETLVAELRTGRLHLLSEGPDKEQEGEQ